MAHHILCHVSGGIFCQYCGGEGSTKGERDARVQGGLWSNWGADDAGYKATVCHREGFGDGKWIFSAERSSRDVIAWGVWDDSDQ